MITSMQILFGLIIGYVGFLHIADSPAPGCSTLFISGILILEGINRLCRHNR